MVDVSFQVDDSEPQLALEEKAQALNNISLAAFLRGHAVPWFVRRAEERFDGHGDDAVGNWAPLAFPTQGIRRAAGYGPTGPINIRTGEMEDFIGGSSGDVRTTTHTATLKWPDATPQGELGRKLRTAQRGSKSSNTPPRPVIGMSQIDADHLGSALTAWVAEFGSYGMDVL